MGRWSIFRPKVKDIDHRVQGLMTEVGRVAFEKRRLELKGMFVKVMGREPSTVSDADVIEFGARGELATVQHLNKMKRQEDREALDEIPF